jgi:hypothetical protein
VLLEDVQFTIGTGQCARPLVAWVIFSTGRIMTRRQHKRLFRMHSKTKRIHGRSTKKELESEVVVVMEEAVEEVEEEEEEDLALMHGVTVLCDG